MYFDHMWCRIDRRILFFPLSFTSIYNPTSDTLLHERPYHLEYTWSHPNSEVKRGRAEIVMLWGTWREVSVLFVFIHFVFCTHSINRLSNSLYCLDHFFFFAETTIYSICCSPSSSRFNITVSPQSFLFIHCLLWKGVLCVAKNNTKIL